jgi:nucleoside-diphosphate-sugar epimerase
MEQPILVYGDGEQTRAFSDIKYYMEPFDKLLTDFDGEIFNIGADKYFTLNEVALKLFKLLLKSMVMKFLLSMVNHVMKLNMLIAITLKQKHVEL